MAKYADYAAEVAARSKAKKESPDSEVEAA